jgi:hypothetical protein
MKATLILTADEQRRAKRLATYLGGTVNELASEGLMVLLRMWEGDLLINQAGEILGEFGFEEDNFAD